MEPYVEPYGIPDQKIWKAFSVSSIFAPCFLRFKCEWTKVTAFSDKPYQVVLQQVNHEECNQTPWRDP